MLRRLARYLSLTLTDLVGFYIALLTAIVIRKYGIPLVIEQAWVRPWFYWGHMLIWWLPVIFMAVLHYESLYSKRFPFWEEARVLLKASLLAFLITFAIVSLGKKSVDVSRVILTMTWVVSMITLPTCRWAARRLLHRYSFFNERVLILGAGSAGVATLRGVENEKSLGYHVVGFLDDDPEKIGQSIEGALGSYKIFAEVQKFRHFVNMMRITTIIIAMPTGSSHRVTRIVSDVQQLVRQVLLVPELKGVALLNTELQSLFMEQLFLLNIRNNLKTLWARVIKRAFDLTVSGFGLLVFLPVYLASYLAVKWTSSGPAFFTQNRPGKNGKEILIYKFRTMYVDADERLAAYLEKNEDAAEEWRVYRKLRSYDPRLTPVGGFLRKWSIDELPQVFNVFKGEMSMVGPRPYMVDEVAVFEDVAQIIFMARPGLCGLWQASGRNKLSFDERIKLDTWYVLNWSLWLDIILMGKTAVAVFRAEGAY